MRRPAPSRSSKSPIAWVGQGYFAPQALATLMQLIVLGAVLRCLAADGAPRRFWAALLRRLGGLEVEPTLPGRHPRWAPVVALAAFAVIVVSHQLTPPAVLLQVGALWVVLRLRQWWLLALAAAMELGWVALAWPYLSEHATILSFNLRENVVTPGSELVPSLPWLQLTSFSGPVVMLSIGLLAAVSAVAGLRHRRLDAAALILAGAPVLILGMNSYGSEAVYRVYLYMLP